MIDNEISELPVNIMKIAKAAGIRVLKNSEVGLLSGSESGLCVFENGTWHLIYDDEAYKGRRRVIIAHELGHIFLGHELMQGNHEQTFNTRKPKSEEQADAFAIRLLAPAGVLWGLNLHTWEDIADMCGISKAEARKRADRMETLYKRQKFLTSSLEKQVYKQFEEFINENKK